MQNNLFTSPDFYPTPDHLIQKMLSGAKMDHVRDILEPSAGKGNIVDYIRKIHDDRYASHRNKSIDVIEIDPDLQALLRGKEFRVIHDDFLTFNSRKHYDLIIANFPFSNGDDHLAKALQYISEHSGQLICLVNAETIRNLNTSQRRYIDILLRHHESQIDYLPGEFLTAERRTGVEVALINLTIEKPRGVSILLTSLRAASDRPDGPAPDRPDDKIAPNDFRQAMIARFDLECRAGIKLIEEYFALRPYILDRIKRADDPHDYGHPLIELKIGDGNRESQTGSINAYIRGTRHKYWETLLRDPRFNASYTTDIMKDIEQKLKELQYFDFTIFNIESLEQEMRSKISLGIEAAIIKLFDSFSRNFAWDESIANGNLHYYNGWKSNKAHKINHKIIQPMNGFSSHSYGKDSLDYHIRDTLSDMVKVFNFLAGEQLNVRQLVGGAIDFADQTQTFRNMDLRYFETTFYKKGTCHIRFLDPDLLAKFNIFGSQRKAWLPPAYGKRPYDAMTVEEQVVIDEFQGRAEYEKVMLRPDYFLVETNQLMIGDGGLNGDS